jgi:hypothetical protein
MAWIHLAHSKDQWWALVNTANNTSFENVSRVQILWNDTNESNLHSRRN